MSTRSSKPSCFQVGEILYLHLKRSLSEGEVLSSESLWKARDESDPDWKAKSLPCVVLCFLKYPVNVMQFWIQDVDKCEKLLDVQLLQNILTVENEYVHDTTGVTCDLHTVDFFRNKTAMMLFS